MNLRGNLIIQTQVSAKANKFLKTAQIILKAAKKVQKMFNYKNFNKINYYKIL